MLALQIIGRKKSGKTTIMCQWIQKAATLQLDVAAFKQTHHDAAMDVSGTDTAHFAEAGARQVFMKKEGHLFLHQQKSYTTKTHISTPEVSGEGEWQRLISSEIDLVLFEGFKQLAHPKLLLLRPGDTVADFPYANICAVGSIYPDVVKEQNVVDLTTVEKSQEWFSQWVAAQRMPADTLTHFNDQQRAKMVDVSEKIDTKRIATAMCRVKMRRETMSRIQSNQVKKGDVLAVAQVAGIMGAKKTSELIPMCHLIALKGIDLQFVIESETSLKITAQAKALDATGVEMEALVACQLAALTVYDMCKAMDPQMLITDCQLLAKTGGKSDRFFKERAETKREKNGASSEKEDSA